MSEEKEEKELRFLKPVEKVPFVKRAKATFYDEIIKEFIESGLKYAEVKDLGKKPSTITQTLRKRLKKRKIENIQVTRRKNKVYSVKLE